MAPANPVMTKTTNTAPRLITPPAPLGPTIGWKNLNRTLEHFMAQGYTYVEVPWTVPRHITEITFPEAFAVLGAGADDLIGSSEQSFLHLALDGGLERGRYCALTPCFRHEAQYTNTHRPYFMKVELFNTLTPTPEAMGKTLVEGLDWFKKLTKNKGLLDIEHTAQGFDINLNGIEIASYGIRTYNGLTWLYATGLAEPRFSVALRK